MTGGHTFEEIREGVDFGGGDTQETQTSSQEVSPGSQPLFNDEWNEETMEWTPTQKNFYLISPFFRK